MTPRPPFPLTSSAIALRFFVLAQLFQNAKNCALTTVLFGASREQSDVIVKVDPNGLAVDVGDGQHFDFDAVVGSDGSQEDVYNQVSAVWVSVLNTNSSLKW